MAQRFQPLRWTGSGKPPILPVIPIAGSVRMNFAESSVSFAGSPARPRPAVLCVLDGWGCRKDRADNAIAAARHPNFDRMMRECPHAELATSGRAVGLP